MKKIAVVLLIGLMMLGLTGCADEYYSVVEDRTEEGQEVARLSMESDHLIRGYMVSEDGVAVKIVQILEFPYDGEPYRVLIEIDPFEETFLGFENLSGEDGEAIQAWQGKMSGRSLTGNLLAADDSELANLWFSAVVETVENYLFLTAEEE